MIPGAFKLSKLDERFTEMDETRRRKLFEDMLSEALSESNSFPSAKPRAKSVKPCGCESKCGDVSKHDEDTVLVGIVLDA